MRLLGVCMYVSLYEYGVSACSNDVAAVDNINETYSIDLMHLIYDLKLTLNNYLSSSSHETDL